MLQACQVQEEEEAKLPSSENIFLSSLCANIMTENISSNTTLKRKFTGTEELTGTQERTEGFAVLLSEKVARLEDIRNYPIPGDATEDLKAVRFVRGSEEEDEGEDVADLREDGEDDEDDEDEILLCPIRAETYILDESDAAFVASDNEIEMASSLDVKAEVNTQNILPETTRRTRKPPDYMSMVPTPDDDALLVDDGETSSDFEEIIDGTAGDGPGPQQTARNVTEDEDLLDEIDGEWMPETPHEDEGDNETDTAFDRDLEGDSSELDDIAEWDDDL